MEAAGAIDLGFYVGPRINAAGRMDDASVGIRCLITDDEQEAASLAEALEQTNQLRKAVQAEIQEEAEALAQGIAATDDYALVVANPQWHEGVIGIVAGRLKERYRRPAIVFAAGEEGLLKGSCRSIAALHMRDAIDAVDFCMDHLKSAAWFWKRERRADGWHWIEPRAADHADLARWQDNA